MDRSPWNCRYLRVERWIDGNIAVTCSAGFATRHRCARRWLERVAFCLLLCAAPAPLAQSYGLDVQPASQPIPTAEPRKIVTLRFRVTNRGPAGQFEAHVNAPPGWQVVANESPFQLAEG